MTYKLAASSQGKASLSGGVVGGWCQHPKGSWSVLLRIEHRDMAIKFQLPSYTHQAFNCA